MTNDIKILLIEDDLEDVRKIKEMLSGIKIYYEQNYNFNLVCLENITKAKYYLCDKTE